MIETKSFVPIFDRIFHSALRWISFLSVVIIIITLKITAGRSLLRLTATIRAIFSCRLSPWGSGAMNVKVATKIKTQYFGSNSRFIWYYQYQLKWGSIDWFWCEHFFWFRHVEWIWIIPKAEWTPIRPKRRLVWLADLIATNTKVNAT